MRTGFRRDSKCGCLNKLSEIREILDISEVDDKNWPKEVEEWSTDVSWRGAPLPSTDVHEGNSSLGGRRGDKSVPPRWQGVSYIVRLGTPGQRGKMRDVMQRISFGGNLHRRSPRVNRREFLQRLLKERRSRFPGVCATREINEKP